MDGDNHFGKSRLALVSVIERCLSFQGKVNPLTPETIVVVLPTLVQAKRVLWKPLQNVFESLPGVTINKSEHRIIVPGKPNILLAGAESGEGLRGQRIYFAAIDEAQDCSPKFLNEVISPAMADTPGSKLLMTGTPKGKVNLLYKLSQEPSIQFFNFPTADNPFVSRDEIERARGSLPPKAFKQEFEADFVSFGGAIYSEFDEDRNTYQQLPNSYDRAFMGVDFGDVNPAYVVVVMVGQKIYVVEAKQLGDGTNPVAFTTFEREIQVACEKWGVYRIYCDPSRPSAIQDLRRRGKIHRVGGLERAVAGENKILPGLSLVNALFYQRRLLLDRTAQDLVDEITSYHRKQMRGTDEFEDKVEDNQIDHRADALRYVLYSIDVRSKGKLLNPVEDR